MSKFIKIGDKIIFIESEEYEQLVRMFPPIAVDKYNNTTIAAESEADNKNAFTDSLDEMITTSIQIYIMLLLIVLSLVIL